MSRARYLASLVFVAVLFTFVGLAISGRGKYQVAIGTDGNERVVDTSNGATWRWGALSSDPSGNPRQLGWTALGSPTTQPLSAAWQPVLSEPAVAGKPEVLLSNASNATELANTFRSLKATKDEGNLTDEEYNRARTEAIKSFQDTVGRIRFPAQSLHDETAYLTGMKNDDLLTDQEYKQARAAVVSTYLPNAQ